MSKDTDSKSKQKKTSEQTLEHSEESEEKHFVTGRAGRMAKLGGLSGKVSASYLGTKVKGVFSNKEKRDEDMKRSNLANIRRVVETLGEMKGAVMKVGQMLSLQADLLPPELADILADLQKQAPPVKFKLIQSRLREEWGTDYRRILKTIDRRPIASASIGQVHKAMLADGRKVVIKIRYPGVAEAVDSDMNNLRSIAATLGRAVSNTDFVPLFEEVRERLAEELDYLHEMRNLQLYSKAYADRPDVVIPEPIEEFCTSGLLVMTREEGDDGPILLQPEISQERRNRLATMWVELLFDQFFNKRMLHADPNLGNFAFRGDDTIVMYDFGCVKTFPEEFVENARNALRVSLTLDTKAIIEAVETLGLVYLGKNELPEEMVEGYSRLILDPVLAPQPYTIGATPLHEGIQKLVRKYYKETMNFQPPRDILFVNRTVAGMYGTLNRWKACIDTREILERYI